MKVVLEPGKDIKNGYVNIFWRTQVPQKESPNENTSILMGDPANLDPLLENGTVEEMIFNPPLNSMQPNSLMNLLSHWKNKLAKNGVLKVHALDIRILGKCAFREELELHELHQLIYGSPETPLSSIMDLASMKEIFKQLGFHIKYLTLNKHIIYLEASNVSND